MSGFDVLRALRFGKINTPVLILSGLNGIEQKVKGFGLGADDYLTKPFQSDELIARIRAILRRSGDQVESVIRCGDLTLKLDQKRAEMGRRDLGLTRKEYQILELLGIRQGTPITKDMFLGLRGDGRASGMRCRLECFSSSRYRSGADGIVYNRLPGSLGCISRNGAKRLHPSLAHLTREPHARGIPLGDVATNALPQAALISNRRLTGC